MITRTKRAYLKRQAHVVIKAHKTQCAHCLCVCIIFERNTLFIREKTEVREIYVSMKRILLSLISLRVHAIKNADFNKKKNEASIRFELELIAHHEAHKTNHSKTNESKK